MFSILYLLHTYITLFPKGILFFIYGLTNIIYYSTSHNIIVAMSPVQRLCQVVGNKLLPLYHLPLSESSMEHKCLKNFPWSFLEGSKINTLTFLPTNTSNLFMAIFELIESSLGRLVETRFGPQLTTRQIPKL